MTRSDDVLNIILGACGVAYSLLPPHRVPGYRRSIALVLRVGGMILLLTAAASVALDHRPSAGHGTLDTGGHDGRQHAGGRG